MMMSSHAAKLQQRCQRLFQLYARSHRGKALPPLGATFACRHNSTVSGANSDPFADPSAVPASQIIVYGRPTSRVQKVLFTLETLGVPYTRVDMPSPPPSYFYGINPLGLVPAIRDEGYVLTESNAICVYLSRKYGGSSGMFPDDPVALGTALRWADFVESYLCTARLNPLYHAAVHQRYPPSAKRAGCPSAEEIDTHRTNSTAAMGILEAHLDSTSGRYLADTDRPTFADTAAGPWLHRWYVHAADGTYGAGLAPEQFPACAAYYERVAAFPGFAKVVE